MPMTVVPSGAWIRVPSRLGSTRTPGSGGPGMLAIACGTASGVARSTTHTDHSSNDAAGFATSPDLVDVVEHLELAHRAERGELVARQRGGGGRRGVAG